ncbi:MAG: hypothetical protein O7B25_09215 [Gammaproteobacteria bacterium]|nr:hypothetical protein [Gammaproteobacteria bacterium]
MKSSSKACIGLGTFLLMAATTAMAIAPSSPAEKRGFKYCVQAVERDLRDLKVESTYYTNTFPDSREYYLNARATLAGTGWGMVRIACETSRSGFRVLAVKHESGRYVGRVTASGPVEVAGN